MMFSCERFDASTLDRAAMSPPQVAAIDSLMSGYSGEVPGAAVAVLHAGFALRRSYGLADLESRTPVTPATSFRLASLSKQFTAAAVLLLAEDGALTLDDSVRAWLPSLPAAADGATLRHLLTHTSGLMDFEEVMPEGITAQLRDADVLDLIERENRRHFAPGSAYRYSNTGYALLALIVEQASRRRYAAFLRERFFEPLGMRQTVAHEAGLSVVAHRAFGYSLAGSAGAGSTADTVAGGGGARGVRAGGADGGGASSWVRTDQSLTSATLGDGGVYSSADDLTRWDRALDDGKVLLPASLRAAFTPATETDERGVGYGFGWRISAAERGGKGGTREAAREGAGHAAANGDAGVVAWHSGESVGFRTVMLRYLEPRCTVIVLTNRSAPSPLRAAVAIAGVFVADADAAALPEAAAGPDAAARPMPS
ncbi:MAG TPA: serine hydrolase domain-containing protein [Steroidobacteraceae bacterium]|jgi:CubicO group peptidase (beta-lactamase class C family)|nr:serine hydrolase domain-containing protein [Steroidobacteraceae bacterium]